MANHMEPAGTAGGAASGSGTSQSEAAMQDTSVAPGGATEAGAVAAPGIPVSQQGPFPTYHGRTVSWTAVAIMVAGFLIGGLAMVFGHHGPIWWLFWVGAGAAVLGLLISVATNMFEDWY